MEWQVADLRKNEQHQYPSTLGEMKNSFSNRIDVYSAKPMNFMKKLLFIKIILTYTIQYDVANLIDGINHTLSIND